LYPQRTQRRAAKIAKKTITTEGTGDHREDQKIEEIGFPSIIESSENNTTFWE
jgi:hypothetical protein